MIRWILDNVGTLLLSIALSLVVWVAAINAEDPLETRDFPNGVSLVYENLPEGLVIVGDQPLEGKLTLRAPVSIWEQISRRELRLVVDLASMQPGINTFNVVPQSDLSPVRFVAYEPQTVNLAAENLLSRRMAVRLAVMGDAAVGFQSGTPQVTPLSAMVSGPESLVRLVASLHATVDISGRRDSLSVEIFPQPLDDQGVLVSGVTVEPLSFQLSIPIEQLGGVRTVAVIPTISGQIEPGYRVTNITVTPTLVTLQSSNPQDLDRLPGFVSTEVISLTGARENISRRVPLDLPPGFTVVGDQSVLVQITIAPIESSLTVSRELVIIGLDPNFTATASPTSVRVILTGPLPTLEALANDDVRVTLDLFGYSAGTHQVLPLVLVLPTDLVIQTVLPESVEVTITPISPTATPEP